MLTLSFQRMEAPYLSTLTPSFCYSNSSLSTASLSLLDYHDLNAYFPMPYDDINWPTLEELSDEASSNFSDVGPSQYLDPYEASFPKSSNPFNTYSQHVDLEKITEFEKWESPLPAQIKTETREISTGHRPSSFSYPDLSQQRPSIGPRRHSSHSLAASHDSKSYGRSEPYSPSRMPQMKRSQISPGKPARVLLTDAELELELEKASFNHVTSNRFSPQKSSIEKLSSTAVSSTPERSILVAKPKSSPEVSHSLVERKYRESLKSRIILLDQALASPRQSKIDDGAGE